MGDYGLLLAARQPPDLTLAVPLTVPEEDPSLRRLAVGLCVKWRSLLCHKRMRGVCDTNNMTERVDRQEQDKIQDAEGI